MRMNSKLLIYFLFLWSIPLASFAASKRSEEQEVINAIFLVLLAFLFIAAFIYAHIQKNQLNDPANKNVIYLNELATVSTLSEGGNYLVCIFRQSGNLQQEHKVYSSPNEAIAAAVSTFTRAGIGYVVVSANNSNELAFSRPYHNHRGSNEGKKVGSARITKLS
jgi:hypothetical protein